MKAKFDESATPPKGKLRGAVYQSYRYGPQLMSLKRNSRSRYPFQWDMSNIMIFLVRAWSALEQFERDAWVSWSLFNPQPVNDDPTVFLTGYQNFLKRNFYELLFYGRTAPLIRVPELINLNDSIFTPALTVTSGQLLLTYSTSRSGSDILAGFFISKPTSIGKNYISSEPRYMTFAGNETTFQNNFGLLYNGYTFLSASEISPAGWHVLTRADYLAILFAVYGGTVPNFPYTISNSNSLRVPSLNYWFNSNGTNTFLFNSRGSGSRDGSTGGFSNLKNSNTFFSTTPAVSNYAVLSIIANNNISYGGANGFGFSEDLKEGLSLRHVKDSTSLPNGSTGSMVGNDGKSYGTIVINGIEIMSENLCETKFRDGSVIPEITNNSSWAAATTPALCAYNNLMSNAFTQTDIVLNITENFINNFGILPSPAQWVMVRIFKVGKLNGQFFPVQNVMVQIQ